MKKYGLLLFAVFAVLSLSAQGVSLGVKGGYEAAMGYSDLWASSVNQVKSGFASGYQVGGWLRVGGKKVYLQPEVLLNVKNTTQTFDVDGTVMKATYKTKAIEIPLLVGYRLLSVGPVALRVNAGPKAVFDVGSSSNLAQYSKVVSQNFKAASWALDGGLGLDILMVSLDVRYSRYLTNTSTVNFQNNQPLNLKNNKQSLSVTLGWKFF